MGMGNGWMPSNGMRVEDSTGKVVIDYPAQPRVEPGIHPTEYKILIKPDAVDEKFAGSTLLKPNAAQESEKNAQMRGTLIAVSPFAFSYEKWPEESMKPQVGDRVLFAKYAGANVKGNDGVDYRIVNDKDIAAVLR